MSAWQRIHFQVFRRAGLRQRPAIADTDRRLSQAIATWFAARQAKPPVQERRPRRNPGEDVEPIARTEHFFAAATAAACGDGSRGGKKLLRNGERCSSVGVTVRMRNRALALGT